MTLLYNDLLWETLAPTESSELQVCWYYCMQAVILGNIARTQNPRLQGFDCGRGLLPGPSRCNFRRLMKVDG